MRYNAYRAIYRVILQRTILYSGRVNRVKGGRILAFEDLNGSGVKIFTKLGFAL